MNKKVKSSLEMSLEEFEDCLDEENRKKTRAERLELKKQDKELERYRKEMLKKQKEEIKKLWKTEN